MNPNQLRTILASSLGTILEWYDFSLFAYLTPILSKLFFPQNNPLTALMLTYAIFAVGFFVRPLGAILFGQLGDRIGRKKTLMWSILLMSIPTCLIGFIPTYETIGLAAPIILILCRICQGLSAGGESTGAILFVLESVTPKRRGFMGAFVWGMVGIGMLAGSMAASIVFHFENNTWTWRIPFALGLLTGLIGYFLRNRTLETTSFINAHQAGILQKYPLVTGISYYKKEMAMIIGLYTLSAMVTYLLFIFMPTYATKLANIPLDKATVISTIGFFAVTILVPVGGYMSDEFGRTRCLYLSVLGFVFLSYPLFYLISLGNCVYFALAEAFFVLLAIGFQGSLNGVIFDLLPTPIRYSVSSFGYNISYSFFGGTAPLIATFLVTWSGNKAAPGFYLLGGAILALISIQLIRSDSASSQSTDFLL